MKEPHPGQGEAIHEREMVSSPQQPNMPTTGKALGTGNVKVAFAVELPADLLKEILRWLLFGVVLSQHHQIF